MEERLQKVLAAAGVASRREAEKTRRGYIGFFAQIPVRIPSPSIRSRPCSPHIAPMRQTVAAAMPRGKTSPRPPS